MARSSDTDASDEPDVDRLDVVFGILQNERRRRVLRYLQDHEATTQGNLAEYVASIENDVPPGSLTSTQRKRVYVSLYQSHLPKLDDVDAIDYDSNRGTVERTPATDRFLSYLDRAEKPPRNPAVSQVRYLLGAAAVLAAALVVTLLVGPSLGPGVASAFAVVSIVLACGLLGRGLGVL
ncbi:MAG: hypothetical protein ABEJ81_07975 [Haloferacaceae archaeon]